MAPRPVRFEFSAAERDRAIRVGEARQAFHDERGTSDAHGLRVSRSEAARINRVGALAELCVATWLGVADEWVEVSADYHALPGDVLPGIEVRSTHHPHGRVLLHRSDHDDRAYVLVRTQGANQGWVELAGWVLGRDGKREEFWPGSRPERPCFMVPTARLRAMDDLTVRTS